MWKNDCNIHKCCYWKDLLIVDNDISENWYDMTLLKAPKNRLVCVSWMSTIAFLWKVTSGILKPSLFILYSWTSEL